MVYANKPSFPKVVRRSSYKGNVSSCSKSFPLDCATLPGLVGCVCVILSGRGLSRELLQAAHRILQGLSEAAKIMGTFKLLPNDDQCWIDLADSKVSKRDVKKLLGCIGVGWSRRLWLQKGLHQHCFVEEFYYYHNYHLLSTW